MATSGNGYLYGHPNEAVPIWQRLIAIAARDSQASSNERVSAQTVGQNLGAQMLCGQHSISNVWVYADSSLNLEVEKCDIFLLAC